MLKTAWLRAKILNGIQEVSGSIPLISTKRKRQVLCLSFPFADYVGEPLTSCIIIICVREANDRSAVRSRLSPPENTRFRKKSGVFLTFWTILCSAFWAWTTNGQQEYHSFFFSYCGKEEQMASTSEKAQFNRLLYKIASLLIVFFRERGKKSRNIAAIKISATLLPVI